jgi:hypothetical protein
MKALFVAYVKVCQFVIILEPGYMFWSIIFS